MTAPPHPVVAFDLDGTLLAGQSQVYLVRLLVRRRWCPAGLLLRVLWWFLLHRLGVPLDVRHLQRRVVARFAGVPQAWFDAVLDELVADALMPNLRPRALAEIAALHRSGASVVLVSASLAPIAARLAERLGLAGAVATEIAPAVDGRFSGRIAGDMVIGEAKMRHLSTLATARFGRWELVAAYADHHSDLPLMRAARRAVAVCPTPTLRKEAIRSGWTIAAW